MRRHRLRAGERTFIKNVAVFMSGRSVATAITLLLTPVISRLYLPEHFGAAAVLLSTVAVIGPLSCGSYEKAVTVARTDADARALMTLCLVLAVVVSLVVSPIVAGLSYAGVLPGTLLALGALLWVLPIAVALDGLTSAAAAWILRHKRYPQLATSEIVQTSLRSGTRVAAGMAVGSTVGALLWSYVIGFSAKLWVLLSAARATAPIGRWLPNTAQLRALPEIARSYRDFPRYNMVTGFMMQLTSQLPVFVLGAAFGAEVVGFFAMSDRLMRAPINITTNTLRQVVLQKFSEIWRAERPIRAQLRRTVAVLLVLAVVPVAVFWTAGEELFTFVLGHRWATAGRYIEILAPYFVIGFIGAPFQAATAAMRRQRLWFWMEMCTAVARLSIIPVAAKDGVTPETVLSVYVWTTVITKLTALAIVYHKVPRVHPGFPARMET